MSRIRKNIPFVLLFLLGMVTVIVWYVVFYVEMHRGLRVTFFDVGQGDGILIETPLGNQILIDGGPSEKIVAKLGQTLPFWDRSIDMLILTHPHADHIDGLLEVLKRYDVNMVMESGVAHSIPEYREWHTLLKEKNVRVVLARRGQMIDAGGGARLMVLAPFEDYFEQSPNNIHNAMVVSRLVYGSGSILFMGDAEKMVEYRLVHDSSGIGSETLHSDILKVGHHGSKTSTTDEFLRAVTPSYAIISVGRKNRYGHPYQEVLYHLISFGSTILRTDQDGDIQFINEGTRFRLVNN